MTQLIGRFVGNNLEKQKSDGSWVPQKCYLQSDPYPCCNKTCSSCKYTPEAHTCKICVGAVFTIVEEDGLTVVLD